MLAESDYIKSVIVGLFLTLAIAMMVTLVSWSIYAYKNPTSPSGIWLIEVSPKPEKENKRVHFETLNLNFSQTFQHRPTRLATIFMSYLDKSAPGSSRFQNPVA
jgi:hypothetical protein